MKFLKLLFLLISFNLNAQESRFKDGETLNVWASSGLNLRGKPDAKSPKIATVPYGAKVVVQPQIGLKISFEVEEFKGFVVRGHWLLVKYGSTEGWVFDGFLSRLPAPNKKNEDYIETYLDNNVGKVGSRFNIKIWDSKDDSARLLLPNEIVDGNEMVEYSQRYEHNIVYESLDNISYNGFKLSSNQLRFFELYVLAKSFLYNPDFSVMSVESNNISIKPKDDEGGCYYDIFTDDENNASIAGGCGC